MPLLRPLILLAAVLLPAVGFAFPGEIRPFAGTGAGGYDGDAGPAVDARLREPADIATDAAGSFYIADTSNHRIRRVDAGGTISTVAGSGSRGDEGDGGPAVYADLDSPEGVAIDPDGRLLIADTGNHRLRRVDLTTGLITTIAGTGREGDSGDGNAATDAELADPRGLTASPAGHIYFADSGNHRIRRIHATTGIITTVVGDGDEGHRGDGGSATSARVAAPWDVALDSSGDLYIADTNNHMVRKVNVSSGIIRTIAGNGSSGYGGDGAGATDARLKKPRSVAVDSGRNLYIGDHDNNRVRRVEHATGLITTVAGNGIYGSGGDFGLAVAAELRRPTGLALDAASNLYLADTRNDRVRRVETPPFSVCGDGNAEPGEQCDDGNLDDGDCCSSSCRFEATGTLCRAAAGSCDPAEFCTGASGTCPADARTAAGTVCRNTAGGCDLAEVCDGSAATCPADAFRGDGEICRATAGLCDVAERCDGTQAQCPLDEFQDAGTSCRATAGICDVAENCTGAAAACPADSFIDAGTLCRGARDVCDAAETCTGTAAACPADAHEPASRECRAARDACDLAETCTGSDDACPLDAIAPAGMVCRAEAGGCDLAEVCSGDEESCPADVLVSAGEECRAVAGVCDIAESCTGSAAACPTDQFLPASAVCRPESGGCDQPETCTGSGASCPDDAFRPAGTICRETTDVCDPSEACEGDSALCPTDRFLPDDLACDDDNEETMDESCLDGICGCRGPDLDGDGITDNCDAFESTLLLEKVILRAPAPGRGKAVLQGSFAVGTLGAEDRLDASEGLRVEIHSGIKSILRLDLPPDACRTAPSGKLLCKSFDRRTRLKLLPARPRTTPPSGYAFKFVSKRLSLEEPLVSPITFTITTNSIDRSGQIEACFARPGSLRCR